MIKEDMEKYNLKNKTVIKMLNVLFATTSERDYEMERLLLLEDMSDTEYNEFVLVEGYHCSCYDFDETNWDCTKLTKDELNKLLEKTEEWETVIKEIIKKDDEYTRQAIKDYFRKKYPKENLRFDFLDEEIVNEVLELGIAEYQRRQALGGVLSERK